jgi:DNA-binding NarL/FixJ family response regulator
MKNLRILIADDHALVRHGVRVLCRAQRGWRVVGEAANGREAVERANKLKPDLVILDISMPDLDGLQLIRQIRESLPDVKVLILTMHESDQMVRRVLEAGAHGYVLKSDLAACLVKGVKHISDGKRFLTPKVSEIVLESFLRTESYHQKTQQPQARPTPREMEIIRLLAEGKANKEIAALLGITVRTVETHRAKIMAKLGIHSIAELIHYAMRRGVFSPQGASG